MQLHEQYRPDDLCPWREGGRSYRRHRLETTGGRVQEFDLCEQSEHTTVGQAHYLGPCRAPGRCRQRLDVNELKP